MNLGISVPAPFHPFAKPRAAHAFLQGIVAHLPTATHPARTLPKEDGVGLIRPNRHLGRRHFSPNRPQQPAGTPHRPFTRRGPSG